MIALQNAQTGVFVCPNHVPPEARGDDWTVAHEWDLDLDIDGIVCTVCGDTLL